MENCWPTTAQHGRSTEITVNSASIFTRYPAGLVTNLTTSAWQCWTAMKMNCLCVLEIDMEVARARYLRCWAHRSKKSDHQADFCDFGGNKPNEQATLTLSNHAQWAHHISSMCLAHWKALKLLIHCTNCVFWAFALTRKPISGICICGKSKLPTLFAKLCHSIAVRKTWACTWKRIEFRLLFMDSRKVAETRMHTIIILWRILLWAVLLLPHIPHRICSPIAGKIAGSRTNFALGAKNLRWTFLNSGTV